MKPAFAALAGLFLLSACNAAPEAGSLVDRHIAALGGEAAIENVGSIRVQVEVTEPEFTVRGNYRADRNGHMRIDIFADDTRVFTEAMNGETGWQMFASGEVADLSPEGEAALRQGITGNLFGLHEYEGLGHQVSEGATVTIDGIDYRTIDIVLDNGHERRLYLDPQTFLVARERSEFALHPDLDPDEEIFETRYSDYREVGGVIRAFASERINLRTGEVAQTTRIESIQINPDLDPAQFERPASPQSEQ
ncbi:hypothetical protein [Hyphobacterium marinum]|uniref:Outer membrane lipoprotein-sorting protein n=1 Tax=Hyphobacterium marinum TaxID=3116574 RepID=A0ABU7LX40_9PROT|nr:hypothetical protein [Hyphobacterium sp. Y6023]MEE2566134.1 hypothetical protein [Hyphobacterium sp. Y6023]